VLLLELAAALVDGGPSVLLSEATAAVGLEGKFMLTDGRSSFLTDGGRGATRPEAEPVPSGRTPSFVFTDGGIVVPFDTEEVLTEAAVSLLLVRTTGVTGLATVLGGMV
jgi:hypothetical protein